MLRALAVRGRILLVRLGFRLGRLRPQRASVLMAASHTSGLAGNLAALRTGLERRAPGVRVRSALPRRAGRRSLRPLWHMRDAFVAGFRLAGSRVILVDDYFLPLYVIRPRPGTTVIQVWHACGAFKRFGYSVVEKSFGADEQLLRRVRIHANYDVCLVSSSHVAPAYAEAFDQPLERFRSDLGIPRTDELVAPGARERAVSAVRERYAIPNERRIILYAPTFRGDSVRHARADGLPDFHQLRDAVGDGSIILLRLHPFIHGALRLTGDLAGFVVDVSAHPDINDLLLAADVLVTDYSSVIFEFALHPRPMLFFAPDLEAYEAERGFYLDYLHDLPGPVVRTSAELASALAAGSWDLARVAAFRDRSFDVADGHATERVIERLILPALGR